MEKKEKEEMTGPGGEEEVKEGPSVEMKQEDVKESVDVKPDKENLPSTNAETSTKPPGEKYTPKVRHQKLVFRLQCSDVSDATFHELNGLCCTGVVGLVEVRGS